MKNRKNETEQQNSVVEWLAPDDAQLPPELSYLEDPEDADAPSLPWYKRAFTAACKWLVMVLVFILLALGASLMGLYHSVDITDLPSGQVTFGTAELNATEYRWTVPVAGPLDRTLKYTGSAPQDLGILQDGHPALEVPEGMDMHLVLMSEGGEVLFDGGLSQYNLFRFAQNGFYTGKLVLSQGEKNQVESFEAVGHYTYEFSFQLEALPKVTMSGGRHVGGSVIGVRVSGLLGETAPILHSELGEAGFVKRGSDWVAYLPVSAFQQAGEYTVQVQTDDFVTEETMRISYRTTQEQDCYTANGTAAIPYLGDAPAKVKGLFSIADPEVYWAENGFIRPVYGRTVRNYESMEYIDRIVDPLLRDDPATIEYNKTCPARHSLNVTFATRPGDDVICPADGRVVFTGTVMGGGRCIAVEHGCGLKSVFYLLANYAVNEGDYVPQGTLLGTTQGHTICEVWLNDVPLNPWEVWGGHGGLFF